MQTADPQAPYHVSYFAAPALAPAPLEVAILELTTRLRLTALAAGLPDVCLATRTIHRSQAASYTSFSLLATMPGVEWHKAPIAVEGSTLDEVEIKFLEALAERLFHQADLVHEEQPQVFGNQQLASYLALAAAA